MSGRSEIVLSEPGRAEAHGLARKLAHRPLAAIHSSPRRRAVDTAAIVAKERSLPIREAAALDEIDFGSWSGRSFAELDADPSWRRWNSVRATARTPAGETMMHATARALDHISAIDENGPVLCVSHCDIIRGVVARVLGLRFDRMLAFDCDPASLTTIEANAGCWRVVTLNERPQ